jgi:V8-like Glu-specific endopeptidase
MIDPGILARVRNGVCAVGYLSVPLVEYERRSDSPFFQVVGTGFLVRNTTVMTNRHVIEGLVSEQSRLGFPLSQMFLSFVVPGQSGGLRNTVRMIRHYGVVSDDRIDVGFVEFKIVQHLHFEGIAPLEFLDTLNLRVSEEIAVYGYPYGTAMLERDGSVYRWGPVVQQGWISGISPFETASSPDEILLDVRTAGGMSGAPIFRPGDGRVIGIHHSGWEATTALGQPIDRAHLVAWLSEYDTQLQAATSVAP